jgi:hypothetical protein
MKVTIEGCASFDSRVFTTEEFNPGKLDDNEDSDVPIEVIGHPDEELRRGEILLVHPKVSLKLCLDDLQRALRPFFPHR